MWGDFDVITNILVKSFCFRFVEMNIVMSTNQISLLIKK